MASPNSVFVANSVLSAAQQNNLPFGICGVQTLTSQFTTSATHTTFQDTGMTLTITEVSGRIYQITAYCYPYPNGGDQTMLFQMLRNATVVKKADFPSNMLNTGVAVPVVISFTYTSVASGSSTFKMQLAAQTSNSAVADYGAATYPRQFVIQDIGST
jgi:hypothetical protein